MVSKYYFKDNYLDIVYRKGEQHFWYIIRKELIYSNIKDLIKKEAKVIEIGCGTGYIAEFLNQKGYENIFVGDLQFKALQYARNRGIGGGCQFSLMQYPFKPKTFEAVLLFDLLEHIDEDVTALKRVSEMLKDGGYVVLTVPAHKWLWSNMDVIVGHKRRYTKKMMKDKLDEAGFTPLKIKYFFSSIVPLLILRKLIYSQKVNDEVNLLKLFEQSVSINSFINKILLRITKLECVLNLPSVVGGSLIAIGRKSRRTVQKNKQAVVNGKDCP